MGAEVAFHGGKPLVTPMVASAPQPLYGHCVHCRAEATDRQTDETSPLHKAPLKLQVFNDRCRVYSSCWVAAAGNV